MYGGGENNNNGSNNNNRMDGNNGGYNGNGGRNGVQCYECGKMGHIARDCWAKRPRTGQREDEVRIFVRNTMKEKEEERERRAKEEEQKRKEDEEWKRELDIARRTEEMRLLLQADIEEKWRQQLRSNAEAAKVAAATESVKAKKGGTENAVERSSAARASPKTSPKRKTSGKGKKKGRNARGKTKRSTRRSLHDCGTSDSEEESGSEACTDSGKDTEGEALKIVQRLREERRWRRSKKKLTKGKEKVRQVASTYEKGECSRRQHTPTAAKDSYSGERKTPLTDKYKGIPASCSQQALVDYTPSVMKEYSKKRVSQLWELCDKHEIKSAKKDEMVVELVTKQTEMAYEGFFTTPTMAENKTKARMEGPEDGAEKTPTEVRWRQHVQAADTAILGKAPKLYRWMRRFGIDNFVILPIRHTTEADDFAFKRYLIRDLSSCLNTMGAGRQIGTRVRGRKGRRERKRCGGVTRGKAVVVFETSCGTRTSLVNWLEEQQRDETGGERVVISREGEHWTDDWKQSRARYGMTEVKTRNGLMCLKDARKECQRGGHITFLKIHKTPTTTKRNKVTLRKMLKQPRAALSMARMTFSRLIGLYRTAGLFSKKSTRNKLKVKIDQAVRKKKGVSIQRKVTVKYPYYSRILKTEVRRITESVVEKRVKDEPVASFMKRKIRVVNTKNMTVADLIHNHRRFANTEQVVCGCARFELLVLTRLTEVPDTPGFVANSKNVTRDSQRTGLARVRIDVLEATSHQKGERCEDLDVSRCMREPGVVEAAWTDGEVRSWASRYDWLVCAPIDRNAGDTALICPLLYRHAFGKVFSWNTDYERIHDTEEEVLKKCKGDYQNEGLLQAGSWKANRKLGKAYVIPKDKDLQKWRPIAPACSDPALIGQRRCARALFYLIMRYSGRTNFHLSSVQEMCDKMQKANRELAKEGCTWVVGRCYDVKETFSSISHEVVEEGVRELLRYFDERDWKQVRTTTRGKTCVMSKTTRKEIAYVSMEFETIIKLVRYDLGHVYMRCGEGIGRQRVGIPMGKATSPVLATITCAMAERKWLSALGADRRMVHGWRMVDDVSIVVGYKDDGVSRAVADKVFESFEQCYDSNLKLERKDGEVNYWNFIGGVMYVVPEPLQLHFVTGTKNTVSLRSNGRLKYQTMQDYASYSEKKTKKVVLSVTLKRL
ncbi:hypothetical protein CBR_g53719 [Chara braunii]|uniref:CCHC-type domain-containing protein n=1 Tax=Chara braunii TaxID=69332 RepID=A0A388MB88_CHABU|nr:hypothetical protein CBR_g53719 [Chara braunii]|eukprot:GBG91828.1 hypothetical protein CBR_g53719 [Chara braunii]